MAIPIVFIHHGNANHLFYALWQAKQINPQSRIILLGDQENKHLSWLLGVEHHPTAQYQSTAQKALKNYLHLSTLGEAFERFCIERWFILDEFLHTHPEISQCIYLDSDVLVFDSLERPALDLAGFGMTMVSYSAHTNFISDVRLLDQFCAFVQQHYDEEHLQQWLREHYGAYLQEANGGGISDMTFFHKFRSENPERVGTLCEPLVYNHPPYCFDECITSSLGGFELDQSGFKKLVWREKVPYGNHLPSNCLVKLFTLHFQGKSKQVIQQYLICMNFHCNFCFALNRVYILLQKLQRFTKTSRINLHKGLSSVKQSEVPT
jgi:hypothetical protein